MRACAKICAIAFLGFAIAGILVMYARAQAEEEASVDCENAITTFDMIACADMRYKAADARLNAVYKKNLQDMDTSGAKILRESQRGWFFFRDAECLRYRDMARGGTMAPLLQIGCLADMTQNRSIELENTTEGLAAQPDGVFWQSSTPIIERFDCKNWMRARLGLIPSVDDKGQTQMSVRVEVGPAHIDFPVARATQMAVCGPNVTLSVIKEKEACPSLRLDDGECDHIQLSWDTKTAGLTWVRN